MRRLRLGAIMGKKTKKQRQESSKKANKQKQKHASSPDSITAIFKVAIPMRNQQVAPHHHRPLTRSPTQPVIQSQKQKAAASDARATTPPPRRRFVVSRLHVPLAALHSCNSNWNCVSHLPLCRRYICRAASTPRSAVMSRPTQPPPGSHLGGGAASAEVGSGSASAARTRGG
jgi:hypothetical protein